MVFITRRPFSAVYSSSEWRTKEPWASVSKCGAGSGSFRDSSSLHHTGERTAQVKAAECMRARKCGHNRQSQRALGSEGYVRCLCLQQALQFALSRPQAAVFMHRRQFFGSLCRVRHTFVVRGGLHGARAVVEARRSGTKTAIKSTR
jgi:hypothetical protein